MPDRATRVKLRNAIRGDVATEELEALMYQSTGVSYYVSSVVGASTNDGLSIGRALATVDAAINKCRPSMGDQIIVMPGHTETLSAAGAWTLDVVGISVIGLGRGTDRPQITLDNTAATVVMSAANCRVSNIHFINDVDGLVVGIPVTAAHCKVDNCLFDDATAAKQTVDWVTLSAAADYFELVDCTHHGSDTAGADSTITGAAADHVKIINLVSHGDFAAANIEMTAAWTDCLIEGCRLQNANAVDVCIEGFAAATGWVSNNHMFIATNAQTTGINTPGALALFLNYQTNVGGENAFLALGDGQGS